MNDENLIPCSERTKEETIAIGRKGGIASGIARREKRKTLDLLETILSSETELDGHKMTQEEAYMWSVVKRGICGGSVDLLELVAKLRGELVQKNEVEVSGNIPAVLTDIVDDGGNEPKKRKGREYVGEVLLGAYEMGRLRKELDFVKERKRYGIINGRIARMEAAELITQINAIGAELSKIAGIGYEPLTLEKWLKD